MTARPLPNQNWLQSDINDTEGQPHDIAILVERAAQLDMVGMFFPHTIKYSFEQKVYKVPSTTTLHEVEEKEVPIYVISYPATVHTSYIKLARYGQVYAVVENSASLSPLIHLQEILANIITQTESEISSIF